MIFISGDDADAKIEVVALFQDAGFGAIDPTDGSDHDPIRLPLDRGRRGGGR